jgi:hypothetical protein
MTKILFIRGFNTFIKPTFDGYQSILNVYPKMEYFNYSPNDDLHDVNKRLCKKIKDGKYTHLIGHSMGGGLLMRYMYDHKINKSIKIILLMPMIFKTPTNRVITNIPFISNLKIPKGLFIPNSVLYDQGNFCNDEMYFFSLSQFVAMYRDIMLESTQIVDTINSNPNCVLFYATKESLNIIPRIDFAPD